MNENLICYVLFSSPLVLPPFFLPPLCFLPPVFRVWEPILLYILAEIVEFLHFVGVGLALRPPPPEFVFLTLGVLKFRVVPGVRV